MMKNLIKILVLVLIPVLALAQEKVVTITPSMFEKETDQAYITTEDGWLFINGKDTANAVWKKFKPVDLSIKNATENGKLEGWFKINIKLSDSLTTTSYDVKVSTWSATDLYINGKYVLSTGNTGANGQPYQEYNPFNNPTFPANLQPGKEYVILLHMVDQVSPLPPYKLKSENSSGGYRDLVRIAGPEYNRFLIKNLQSQSDIEMLWFSVCATLCILFWLLYFQNSKEKNLLLIALGTSFLTLAMFFTRSQGKISYVQYVVNEIAGITSIMITCAFVLLILVNIFKRKVTGILKIFLVVYFTGSMVAILIPGKSSDTIILVLISVIFVYCLYYVITSWKNLKGAQWAIVVGLIVSMAAGISYALFSLVLGSLSIFQFLLLISLYALSFPLALMVYIAMRFKEIIKEVHQNADKVVQLSEEKKQQALSRQKLLEYEVNKQTEEIRNSLENLKTTQTQLVQSEKMASLGELTAGIAHEIQNPLNFVNNFSEVSNELIQEIKEERAKPVSERDESLENELLEDISSNLEKINHHGKRADAIVKGMLQHSRSSSGKKEPTDLNALCDEYLRLSYHGLRAKDKSFNATIKTDFDDTIGNVNLIPQDFGRVVLNLLTNAFYAVDEKKKSLLAPKGGITYEPTVTIATKKENNKITINVTDNGNGMPQEVIDKAFQPFFTTKPTGKGTGLGLSMSYDIVTKGHNGELNVASVENEGTTFSIIIKN